MLVHICCSVDSHYFLEQLKEEFPKEKLVGFFYNPNIHPYSEYKLRLLDVQFSCQRLDVGLIEAPYNLDGWFERVKGLENSPEKGSRCLFCFDDRMEATALKAKELGHDKFTSTLLMSPKKSQEKITSVGEKLANRYGVEYIFKDYRSGNGSAKQSEVTRENNLYRQNYCGCMFALSKQREQQQKLADELVSPITKQIRPGSIEERLDTFTRRNHLEHSQVPYRLEREKFLNYRLLNGGIKRDKNVIPSYIVAYSQASKNFKSTIDTINNDVAYLKKGEARLISLQYFNDILNSDFKSTKELYFDDIEFEKEIMLRNTILGNHYDLSPLIVIDELMDSKYEISINSIIYEDSRYKIV
jgi:predicted adenine nucleotide alpha hydrolase (AANH) superfamily ATPase